MGRHPDMRGAKSWLASTRNSAGARNPANPLSGVSGKKKKTEGGSSRPREEAEAKVIIYPDRYMDERGKEMWETVWGLIAEDQSPEAEDSR